VDSFTCSCCQHSYDDPLDLVLFGQLAIHGKTWAICGECIQAMWQERVPDLEDIPMLREI